jgi:glycosyltransferase involved in cell wall biosynthesis
MLESSHRQSSIDPQPLNGGRAGHPASFATNGHSDITVIIAHYDCQELLTRALQSVVEQSHRSWTCLVVDDDSPSREGLERVRSAFADERIRWLRASANVGQFRIYNRLLPVIASPYVALQDADDWSVPQRFERLLDEIDSRRCDVVGSAVTRTSLEGEILPVARPPLDVNKALSWRFRRAVFRGATMLCRTDFMRAVDGYDGTTRFAGDSDFIYRAIFQGSVRNHPEPLYFYTEREGSLTRSPLTGFGSPERVRYASAIRRRFYRHLLLSQVAQLRPAMLKAKPNDMDFDLLSLD